MAAADVEIAHTGADWGFVEKLRDRAGGDLDVWFACLLGIHAAAERVQKSIEARKITHDIIWALASALPTLNGAKRAKRDAKQCAGSRRTSGSQNVEGAIFSKKFSIMSLNIESEEADRLARELAQRTGEMLTQAVILALRERLERSRPLPNMEDFVDDVLELAGRFSRLRVLAARTADEILGYDEHGVSG